MKTNVKTSLLITALATIAGVLATQIMKRGGMKPAMADLKAGTASAVEAVKKPIMKLVADNTGTAVKPADEGIDNNTGDDDVGLDDRATAHAHG